MEAHFRFLDHDPVSRLVLSLLCSGQQIVQPKQERGEFALPRCPGHKRQVHGTVNQLQALGVLRILLDTNCSTMKDSRINLVTDLSI